MVAVFVIDRGQRCRFLNAVAEALTGFAAGQAHGMTLAELLWRGHALPFEHGSLGKALAAPKGGEGEETIIAYDSGPRPVSFRVVPLGDDVASEQGAVVELVDLSGETGTSRALRTSEQRLRLAIEATGIGIWDVNAATGQRRWSPEMYSILGVGTDTEADMDLFSRLISPADRNSVNTLYDRAYGAPEDPTFNAEFRIQRADTGEMRWVSVSGRVTFDSAGKPVRGVGTIRDVNERRVIEEALRESEEQNRLAVEANDVGTWDYDLISGKHSWSPIFKRLWGLPPDAESEPKLLHPLASPEVWDRIREEWKQGTRPGSGGKIAMEYEIQRADDGAARWCAFTGRVLFDPMTGRAARALGIMTDITERRKIEERQRLILREMNHRVKNSLALVQAIVSQTMRSSEDPHLAFERIQSRLMALARSHDFLNRSNWAGVALRTLIEGELEAFAESASRVSLEGEQVVLDSSTMFALGLALHELASNAMRYGALSVPEGRLAIDWRVTGADGSRRIEIDWLEREGPAVKPPARQGFGMRLIEANVRATLGGEVKLEYPKLGLHAWLSFPLRPLTGEDSFPEASTASPVHVHRAV